MDFNHSRVLVTGGAGLVGSHIVDTLVRKDCPISASEILVLDNFVRGHKKNLNHVMTDERVRVIRGDIRDRNLLESVMQGVNLVIHQAAIRITQCAEDPRLAL